MLLDEKLLPAIDPQPPSGGIGGRIKSRPEDFIVREIPAYGADGRDHAHILLLIRKREMTTEQAVEKLARQLNISRRDIGVAGMKDRYAVTIQYMTVPWTAAERLDGLSIEGIDLLDAKPHGNKLRRGHLHGNSFEVIVRELDCAIEAAAAIVESRIDSLRARGGLANRYGSQRFSSGVEGVRRDLNFLASGQAKRRDAFRLSVAQAALFNMYLRHRVERGILRTVLTGDILQKLESGGLFESVETEVDGKRLAAGELGITGPIFGSKTRRPAQGTEARELEDEVLAMAGLGQGELVALGKNAPGSRRLLQIPLTQLRIEPVPDVASQNLGSGLRLAFDLPAGSFATVFLAELL